MLNKKHAKLNYGEWRAATLFIASGQNVYEIIQMLNISVSEWNYYNEGFSKFYLLDDKAYKYISVFQEKNIDFILNQKMSYVTSYFEKEYQSLFNRDKGVSELARIVDEKVFSNLHISVFKKVSWEAYFIGRHHYLVNLLFAHDEVNIYLDGKRLIDRNGLAIEHLNPFAFKIYRNHFMGDDQMMLCERNGGSKHHYSSIFTALKKVDINSFCGVGLYYAKDEKAIYHCSNKRLESPSSLSLEPIYKKGKDIYDEIWLKEDHYAKDLHHVYFKGKIISDEILAFQQVELSDYYSDGMFIFYEGKKIENADWATFQIMDSNGDAEDKNFSFCNGKASQK